MKVQCFMRYIKVLRSKNKTLVCLSLPLFLLWSAEGLTTDLVIEQFSESNSLVLGALDADKQYSLAIRQEGSFNHLEANIESDLAGQISQDGINGVINLNTSGEFQALEINQSGELNISEVNLVGADNFVDINQTGLQNALQYSVEGVLNIANLSQSGNDNTIILSQIGSDNNASLEQSGSNNLIDVVQNGGGLVINIVQRGNDEQIIVR